MHRSKVKSLFHFFFLVGRREGRGRGNGNFYLRLDLLLWLLIHTLAQQLAGFQWMPTEIWMSNLFVPCFAHFIFGFSHLLRWIFSTRKRVTRVYPVCTGIPIVSVLKHKNGIGVVFRCSNVEMAECRLIEWMREANGKPEKQKQKDGDYVHRPTGLANQLLQLSIYHSHFFVYLVPSPARMICMYHFSQIRILRDI